MDKSVKEHRDFSWIAERNQYIIWVLSYPSWYRQCEGGLDLANGALQSRAQIFVGWNNISYRGQKLHGYLAIADSF